MEDKAGQAGVGTQQAGEQTTDQRLSVLESIVLGKFDDVISGCEEGILGTRRATRGIMPELRNRVDRHENNAREIVSEMPALDEILERLYKIIDHANSIREGVTIYADRVLGCEPEDACGAGSAMIQPDGLTDKIQLALSGVARQLSRIEEQHTRLFRKV